MPRGGQQKWPDFTEEQKAILLEIANTPAYQSTRGYAWRLAFKEHPEWEKALLTDQSRPMSHLWHASKELQSGRAPVRPFTYVDMKRGHNKGTRNVKLVMVKRGKYKRKAKWPGIEAMQRRKAELKAARHAEVDQLVKELPVRSVAATTFCPHCGSHKSHFGNQA